MFDMTDRWTRKELTISIIGAPIGALFSYFVTKVLDRAGLLDGLANSLGDYLKANISPAGLGLGFGLVIFALLYGLLLLRVWRPRHIYDTEMREGAGVGNYVEAEVVPGPNRKKPTMSADDPRLDSVHGFMEGLRRGLVGDVKEPQVARPDCYPDMALAAVVERVKRRIGAPPNETSQDLDHFIMDGVVNRPLHTWGRRETGKPVTPIWREAWERGDFSHERGTLRYRHPDNPGTVHEWRDIHFSNAEVKRWVRPDLGPHGWMAGDV